MFSEKIKYIADSQKGFARSSNKDGVCVVTTGNDDVYLFAVFDGVSSAKDAKRGVNIATRYIEKNVSSYMQHNSIDLKSLVVDVNEKVLNSKYEEAYSTIAAISVNLKDKKARSVTLGDTRIYKVTPQYIKQVSKDDNLPGSKHVITKCLGFSKINREELEEKEHEIIDSKMLVCTDGFYEVMEENLLSFHQAFYLKTANGIKSRLKKEIANNNSDDASYLLASFENV